jgi:hypothetical protein
MASVGGRRRRLADDEARGDHDVGELVMFDEPIDHLAVPVHVRGAAGDVRPGPERRQRLRDFEGLGLRRAIVQCFAAAKDPRALDDLAENDVAVGMLATPIESRAGP